jgi:hypothetical protein
MARYLCGMAGLAAFAVATAVFAQAPADHIRGRVKSLTGDTLLVQEKSGKPVAIKLSEHWSVVVVVPVDPSAIIPGSFIGTSEVDKPDGTGRSLEVHVFPPGVKIGEGHYPWDKKPHSMMTNGTVGKVVASAKGRSLDVAYPGGEKHILVPPNVPIVQITPGKRELVAPGAKVFIIPTKLADGTLGADTLVVGSNGAAPPM